MPVLILVNAECPDISAGLNDSYLTIVRYPQPGATALQDTGGETMFASILTLTRFRPLTRSVRSLPMARKLLTEPLPV